MFNFESEIHQSLAKISLEDETRKMPLITAIINKKFDEVKQLIQEGADVNVHVPGGGKTPLHIAIELDLTEIASFLIKSKADVNATTLRKFTPLHVAAQKGNCKLITLLVEAGADINACSDVGCTSLHEAAANGQKEAILKLLELKANPNIKETKYHLTAANLAHDKQHILIRDILCTSMTYQQCFIQNVTYILYNWKKVFSSSSAESKFMDTLNKSILLLEDGDEVFKKISIALKSPAYIALEKNLAELRKLLIANMKQYNTDKLATMQAVSNSSSSTALEEKPKNF